MAGTACNPHRVRADHSRRSSALFASKLDTCKVVLAQCSPLLDLVLKNICKHLEWVLAASSSPLTEIKACPELLWGEDTQRQILASLGESGIIASPSCEYTQDLSCHGYACHSGLYFWNTKIPVDTFGTLKMDGF